MSYVFGSKSREKLATCHPDIVTVAELALDISPYDFTIIHGWRGKELQDSLVEAELSRTPWPESKHNYTEDGQPMSLAIDFGPWIDATIPWKDTHIFAVIAGVMISSAIQAGISVRWGGDWDSDGSTRDQTLMDWGHLELKR
jgi:peptidoglycan L-alanyl-D-glutamate endopeptidase CwlK